MKSVDYWIVFLVNEACEALFIYLFIYSFMSDFIVFLILPLSVPFALGYIPIPQGKQYFNYLGSYGIFDLHKQGKQIFSLFLFIIF